MSVPVSPPLRRYRRRILGWGLFGVVVLCGLAAPLFVRSVERDLEGRVPSELAERGFDGVSAAFSGQDGVLRCAAPLEEPEDALDAAFDVWGVRTVELDRSCRVSRAPADGTGDGSTDASTPSPDGTVTGSPTSVPSATVVDDDTPDLGSVADVATSEPDDRFLTVSATLTAGRVVLAGTVADETQRAVLVDGASRVLDPANIDDQLTVASEAAIDDATVRALAELVAVMPPNLVSGESGFDGAELYGEGVFVDADGRTAFEAAAEFVSATVELAPRPTASGDDAEALEDDLNEFVAANPIRFAPTSADVESDALAVLDQLAAIAKQFDGVTITVEGHTDSDSVQTENQTLSEERAETVLAGLVARGVPAADLTSVGLGSTRPIIVDGVEDKDASRRIEFRVTTQAGT
jgi:outer membrane protein OmpA-like peptidoglycan-associated protein